MIVYKGEDMFFVWIWLVLVEKMEGIVVCIVDFFLGVRLIRSSIAFHCDMPIDTLACFYNKVERCRMLQMIQGYQLGFLLRH